MTNLVFVVFLAAAAPLAPVPVLRAQSPAAGPTFEVASIKPSNPNPTGPLGAAPMVLNLGLKLDSQRGSGEVLVIDSAELPTPD